MSRRLSKDMLALVAHLESAVYRAVDEAMCDREAVESEVDDLVDHNINTLNSEVLHLQDVVAAAGLELNAAIVDRDEQAELAQALADTVVEREATIAELKNDCAAYEALAQRYKFEAESAKEHLAVAQPADPELLSDLNRKIEGLKLNLETARFDATEFRRARDEALADLAIEKGRQGDLNDLLAERDLFKQMLTAEEKRSCRLEFELERARQAVPAPSQALTKVTVVADLELTDTALEVINLINRGKNDQQIAAAFNVGKPQNQWLNGPGVAAIREILIGRAA